MKEEKGRRIGKEGCTNKSKRGTSYKDKSKMGKRRFSDPYLPCRRPVQVLLIHHYYLAH